MATAAVQQPTLGMGLSGIADWSTQHPFIDRFKTSRDWIANSETEWDSGIAIATDANGWPLSKPDGVSAITTIVGVDPKSEWPSGRYVVLYEGEGTIDYGLTTEKVSGSKPGYDVVVVDDQGTTIAQQSMFLSITQTNPDNPIRNIRVVREDQLDEYKAGEIFNPAFLDKIEDFRELRYMDWMNTNNSDVVDWADRPTLESANWSNGVPVEVMVELANRTGTDPWFTMPHKASDAYIREFATYVRDHLDPRLKAHVEYSNEVWNWGFEQSAHALEEANKRWAVDSNGNGRIDEDEHIGDGWMQYSGMRTAQTHAIWEKVFGSEANTRLNKVIATQTAWVGLHDPLLNAPLYVAEGKQAPYKGADSYAITGYFEGGLYNAENVDTVLQWANEGAAGMDKAFQQLEFGTLFDDKGGSLADIIDLYTEHGAIAKKYGLDLIMYESGAHLVSSQFDDATNATLTEFFAKLMRDPRMGELYAKNIEAFKAAGGTLFNAFVDVSTPSKYGFWGALESIYDDSSPRWDALVDANNDANSNLETRPADAFTNGVFQRGTNSADQMTGTAGGDNLVGHGGNDQIKGAKGSDTLKGGAGNDRLHGQHGSDTLRGDSGNDFLNGGLDRDTLTGGSGKDTFHFYVTPLSKNADTITDFKAVDDKITLNNSAFTAFQAEGAITAGMFKLGKAAADRDDFVIYDKATGRLYYDKDGSGAAAAGLIAELNPGTTLTAADIFII
jgi:Ca2+-binding RTX toxin-like protein